MTEQTTDQTESGTQYTNASRVGLLSVVATIATFIFLLIYAMSTSTWQAYTLAIANFLVIMPTIGGFGQIRWGNLIRGFGIQMISLQIMIVLSTVFIADLGIYLMLGVILFTLLASGAFLSQEESQWLIIISVLVGFLVLLYDIFTPLERLAPPPNFIILISILIGLMTFIFGAYVLRQFPNFTIRNKLILASLLVSLIPIGLLTVIDTAATRNQVLTSANQNLNSALLQIADDIDTFITSTQSDLLSASKAAVFSNYLDLPKGERAGSREEDALDANLRFLKEGNSYILSYALLDLNGVNRWDTTTGSIGRNEYNRQHFLAPINTIAPYVSSVEAEPGIGETPAFKNLQPVIYFSVPITLIFSEEVLGVLRVRYDAQILQDMIASHTGLAGPNSFVVLFDQIPGNYIHLAHGLEPDTLFLSVVPYTPQQVSELVTDYRLPSLSIDQLSLDLPELNDNMTAALDQGEPFFSATDIATGEEVNQVAIAHLETQPTWVLTFFQPRGLLLEPIETQARVIVVFSMFLAVVVVAGAVITSQVMVRPINLLIESAERITEGDFSGRVASIAKDEFGTLANAFNLMTAEVRSLISGLEERVAERTRDLERRAAQMETASQVASEAAGIRDLTTLLDRTTHLISEGFGFYHTGIFLIDDTGEYAVLQAANSEGGRRMLARKHRLRVGKVGVVGFTAGMGEPRIAQDVGADVAYYDNPDMPQTSSEMALPMKIRDQVIGVLDVQSKEGSAFSEEDVQVLSTVADQIALAIENTRLLEDSQRSLQEVQKLYGMQLGQAWQQRLSQQGSGFTYDRVNVSPIDADSPQTQKSPANDHEMNIPISIGSQTLGSINLQRNIDQPAWTEEEEALVAEIINQAALALNNARLVDEIRMRSDQTQLLQEITAAAASTIDRDELLAQTAEKLQTGMDALRCDVIIFESNNRFGALAAYAPVSDSGHTVLGTRIDIHKNELTQEVIRTQRTLVVYDLQNNPQVDKTREFTLPQDTNSQIIIPLISRDEVIGTIELDIADADRRFDEDDLRLLDQISYQVGSAVDVSELFDQTLRRADRERTVSNITTMIRASNDPQTMIQTTAAELRKALRASRAEVVVRDSKLATSPEPTDGNSSNQNEHDNGGPS